MKKKMVSLMVCMSMAATMVSGCSKKEEATNTGTNQTAETTTEGASSEENTNTSSEGASDNSEASGATDSNAYSVSGMEDTTINIRVMNDYGYIDDVLAKYEEMTKDDPIMSKIHLNFEFVAGADYADKLSMAISTEEDYDLMFCGTWHGFNNYAASGSFTDLSQYFNNPNFPGLQEAFSEDMVYAATSNYKNEDGSYTSHMYRIPLLTQIDDIRGIYYREDLRQKLGCAEIVDDDSMYAYLKAVCEDPELKEQGYLGLNLYSGFFGWTRPSFAPSDHVFLGEIMGANNYFYYRLNDDATKVLGATVMGDDDTMWSFMPDGYQYDYISSWLQDMTKWSDYLSPTRGTTETAVGTFAATYGTLTGAESTFNDLANNEELMAQYPDATLGFYPIFENVRKKEKGSIVSEMIANNQLVVPSWSEKTDAVMCFLNWMFLNQENHDLFQYGIEGVNWEKVGEDGYKLLTLAEGQNYTMPGYSFCWNPAYVRKSEFYSQHPDLDSYYDFMMDESSYVLSPITGFSFDTTKVETEIANLTALSDELQFHNALYGDETLAKVKDWHDKAESAGLENVRTELVNQLQSFLDMKAAK